MTELNPSGSAFVYSSYLGGTNTDIAYGIAVDTTGAAYVAGQTCSSDFPQSNPLPINPGGNCDAFISKVAILQGIAVNPAGLDFSTQSLNTTSQPLTVTITNGQNALNITGITVSGTNAGDFTPTQNCVGPMAPGAQCVVSVTFTPSAAGVRAASLTISNSGAANPTVVVALTGSTSSITLSASTLTFGSPQNPQPVGATSAAQSITVTNSGVIRGDDSRVLPRAVISLRPTIARKQRYNPRPTASLTSRIRRPGPVRVSGRLRSMTTRPAVRRWSY